MTHHALLYRAPAVSKETALPLLPLLAASQIEYVEVDAFGIEDVRQLTLTAYRTPSVGDRLGVVVILKTITVEAEQALLKLLEEPPLTTAFLFCIPQGVFILPTLLSRFSTIDNTTALVPTPVFLEFMAMTIPERIALIGDKLNEKDTVWPQEIKQGLLAFLSTTDKKATTPQVPILYYVVEHLLTRGASNKQLLEELAFSLPCRQKEENGTLYA